MNGTLENQRCITRSALVWGTLICSAAIAAPIPAERESQPPPEPDKELLKIIDGVRANEARYRDLEIVLKTDLSAAAVPGASGWKADSVSKSVYDGDRFYFHLTKTVVSHGLTPVRREVLAAFDGEKTRTIDYGNSVNIHFGRREPAQMVPPHSWVLAGDRVNFALSTLLSGTEGLRRDPKTPDYEGGFGRDFYHVQCHFEDEETVDGLRCFRIGCLEDRPGVGTNFTRLWIAPDRNYLCVKLRATFDRDSGRDAHPRLESSIKEWRKIAAERWLPARIVTQKWSPENDGKTWKVVRDQTQQLQSVVLGPKHDNGFFREIAVPKDVPVFTIQNDQLVDDVAQSARRPDDPDAALRRVIDSLRREEQKFAHLDVRMHDTWRNLADAPSVWFPDTLWTQERDSRWVAVRQQQYHEMSRKSETRTGFFSGTWVEACDGKWLRRVSRGTQHVFPTESIDGKSKLKRGLEQGSRDSDKTTVSASLSRGGANDFVEVFRPHMPFFDFRFGTYSEHAALSDFLTTGIWFRGSGTFPTRRANVTYVGEDRRDGLECDVIRIMYDDSARSEFIWLARDRNLIPVRLERRNARMNRSLPVAFARIEEMREIEKGIWFPIKGSEMGSDVNEWTRNRIGRVMFNWRRDLFVEEASLDPRHPTDPEAKLIIPKGTEISVSIAGRGGAVVRQETTGIATVSPTAWRDAIFQGIVRRSNTIGISVSRNEKIDAMIGAVPPSLPNENWINSRALSWRDFTGRAVVVHFFADSVRLCEPDLIWLAEESEPLAKKGILIVGIHPPNNVESVTRFVSKHGLKYPICIDGPPPDWSASWGRLGDAFDVRIVPTTVLVGPDGKIRGQGTVGSVLRKAELLRGGK
jgi:peroxiredoxin